MPASKFRQFLVNLGRQASIATRNKKESPHRRQKTSNHKKERQMYRQGDDKTIDAMRESITKACQEIADKLQSDATEHKKIIATFDDESGNLDLIHWWLGICTFTFPECRGKKYVELNARLGSGYKISLLTYSGSTEDVINWLNSPECAHYIKHKMITLLKQCDQ